MLICKNLYLLIGEPISQRENEFFMRVRQIIFLILTIIWMVAIFLFSSKPADESARMSTKVDYLLCQIFVRGYRDMPKEKQVELAESIDHPVRKTAHATEYALLGMLLCGTFGLDNTQKQRQSKKNEYKLENKHKLENKYKSENNSANIEKLKRRNKITPWLIIGVGALYATSDEIHQLFVPGRSGQFTDVLIDTGGVVAGYFFVVLVRLIVKGINKKRKHA